METPALVQGKLLAMSIFRNRLPGQASWDHGNHEPELNYDGLRVNPWNFDQHLLSGQGYILRPATTSDSGRKVFLRVLKSFLQAHPIRPTCGWI
jgi:hypothetical protein